MNRREFLKGAVVYSRSIPVAHDVDVFVAGGGPAGVCAALAAARAGGRRGLSPSGFLRKSEVE